MTDSPKPEGVHTIALPDFQKLELRIATVMTAENHPNADRLLVLTIEVGGETRQVVAGIKNSYQPQELVGKQVVVLANLIPATIRGIESQAMVLAAQDSSGVTLLVPDRPVQTGSLIK